MTNMCPRCHGALITDDDQGGASRATPDRDIDVCGPCCVDEAVRQTLGKGTVLVAQWPVHEAHMTWADVPRVPGF